MNKAHFVFPETADEGTIIQLNKGGDVGSVVTIRKNPGGYFKIYISNSAQATKIDVSREWEHLEHQIDSLEPIFTKVRLDNSYAELRHHLGYDIYVDIFYQQDRGIVIRLYRIDIALAHAGIVACVLLTLDEVAELKNHFEHVRRKYLPRFPICFHQNQEEMMYCPNCTWEMD